MLALTPADIDLDKSTIRINKSYQRLNGEDVVTSPKTPKSNRVITIPEGLCNCLRSYMKQCYELRPNDRLFPYTKSFLYHEMENGCKASGVKRIRVHDIRHPNVKPKTQNFLKARASRLSDNAYTAETLAISSMLNIKLCKCAHWCQNSTRLHSFGISLLSSLEKKLFFKPVTLFVSKTIIHCI